MAETATTRLMLTGDVMLGRGIDQILPEPRDATLYETFCHSALDYVGLAEAANGPIGRKVAFHYVWGDALAEFDRHRPDLRIVNLETAATLALRPEPKGINYGMNPSHLPVLSAARIDCATLANNHVLDWGREGLLDTLAAFERAHIAFTGAGRNAAEASRPAILAGGGRRVLVYGFASEYSGVPATWAAGSSPGVNLLSDLGAAAADRIADRITAERSPNDLVVASIHWGGNWGYEVPDEQRTFAHALIDRGAVDVVHGHSSHHPKAIEVYRGKPVFYGCGDFINDYEGIGAYEDYRGELALTYLPVLAGPGRRLSELIMLPFRLRRFRLERADEADTQWLRARMDRECRRFGGAVTQTPDGTLALGWT